jgi:hypothetical protein
MNHLELEANIAWELVAEAVEQLQPYINPYDLDAAIIAVLATALEIASQRKLKPIHEIYEPKSI